jgi:N utilization substance protein B
MLFGLDAAGVLDGDARATLDVAASIARYWLAFEDGDAQAEPIDPDARAFADALVSELVPRLDEIDGALKTASANWRLERMPRVDRNVLRIGAFELLSRTDTPRAVAIDEAVELAKRFGGDESPKFVNGLLERVADDAGRAEPRLGRRGKARG